METLGHSQAPADPPHQHHNTFSLLLLPLELRQKIYAYVLTTSAPFRLKFTKPESPEFRAVNLLRCCRIVYWEASLVFYESNTFHFEFCDLAWDLRENSGGHAGFSKMRHISFEPSRNWYPIMHPARLELQTLNATLCSFIENLDKRFPSARTLKYHHPHFDPIHSMWYKYIHPGGSLKVVGNIFSRLEQFEIIGVAIPIMLFRVLDEIMPSKRWRIQKQSSWPYISLSREQSNGIKYSINSHQDIGVPEEYSQVFTPEDVGIYIASWYLMTG